MKITLRKIAALGTAIATTGAVQAAPLHVAKPHGATALSGFSAPLLLAADGGEAGEGGATEDGDMVFHVGMAEIEGKLAAALTLYEQGETEAAKAHVVRPADDIYTGLKPIMADRNAQGFDAQLTAFADAVDAGAPVDEVKARFAAASEAIRADGLPEAAGELVLTVAHLVRAAGQDFANGVADGKVTDPHEYQDAWGYVQAGKGIIAGAPDWMREEYPEEFKQVGDYLASLDPAWPDLTGKGAPGIEPSVIAAMASRIEIVSLRMD